MIPIEPGQRVLLPQSAIAPADLADTLTAKDATVRVVTAYQTIAGYGGVRLADFLARGEVDAVIFASSSAVDGFVIPPRDEGIGIEAIDAIPVVCIGQSTASTARRHGIVSPVVPVEQTLPGPCRTRICFRVSARQQRNDFVISDLSTPATPATGTAAFPAVRPRRLRRTPALAPAGPRDPLSFAGRRHLPDVRPAGARPAHSDLVDAGTSAVVGRPAGRRGRGGRRARHPGRDALRHSRAQGRDRQRKLGSAWDRAAGDPGDQGGRAGDGRHLRHVPLRVHRSRPLRDDQPPRTASTSTRRCQNGYLLNDPTLELLARGVDRPRRGRRRRHRPVRA